MKRQVMYGKILSTIHDDYFSQLSESASKLIRSYLSVITGPIADLGCGSGQFLCQFKSEVEEGYGSDISENMIVLAKKKIPEYNFEVCDLFDSSIPENVQIVAILGEVLSYACSSKENDLTDELTFFFQKIYSRLANDGVLIFDCLITKHDLEYQKTRKYGKFLLHINSIVQNDILTRHITIESQDSTKIVENHYLGILDTTLLEGILTQVGFSVEKMDHYGDFKLSKGRLGFICSK